jgi:hypothetical protein
MVQSTRPDVSFRKLVLVPLDTPHGAAYETSLSCDRATFAGSRGVCLVIEGHQAATPYAYVFNERFETIHKIQLVGVPTRVRLSPDGRLAAISVSEHTHEDPLLDFVARTILVDTATGMTRDMRHFRFTQEGRPIRVRDFGVWGVTFAADGNRFFATLELDSTKYLVQGNVSTASADVIRTGGECPALSPDNTQLVYKRRAKVDDDARLRVYDFGSGRDVEVGAERRSVVDQVEWLDNERIVYHVTGSSGADVWSVKVDDSEAPKILRRYSYAPAIVR